MAVWSKESGTCAPLFSPEFQRDPYPTYRRLRELDEMEGRHTE